MKQGAPTLYIVMLPALVLCTEKNFEIRRDPVGFNDDLEISHLYKDRRLVTGIAVSRSGRKFSCFPAGLDEANTNSGSNNVVALVELTNFDEETPYPNKDYNNPPGGAVELRGPFPRTKGLSDYFLSIEAVVIDYTDVLWVLDNARVLYNNVLLSSTYGGPKLISIDLKNNDVLRTYILPRNVATPTSFLDEMRFDTERGYAYISDAGTTGSDGIVIVNLQNGNAWRTLQNDDTITPIYGTLPFMYGEPLYGVQTSPAGRITGPEFLRLGIEGLALSPDTDTLYFSIIAGRFLYSVPTELLRNRTASVSEMVAAIRNHGEKGISVGIATDSRGIVYAGHGEQDALSMYNPETNFTTIFIHDVRINFVAKFSVGEDGYLYFTDNQYNYFSAIYPGRGEFGIDRRQTPYPLFRVKLFEGATKGPGS